MIGNFLLLGVKEVVFELSAVGEPFVSDAR